MAENPIPEGQTIDLKWPLVDDLHAQYANQFSIADTGNEIILTFGNFLPTGFYKRSQEEIQEYLKDATITPLAKIVLSRAGFHAFFQLLKSRIDDLDKN